MQELEGKHEIQLVNFYKSIGDRNLVNHQIKFLKKTI